MAKVFPFRAFRYNPAHAPFEHVLTQPYDKISPAMQDKYYAANPHNLITVEKGRAHPTDAPGNNVYTRAAAAIQEWIRSGIVAQDPLALRLMAANPTRIKRIAFGLSIATTSLAGAVLIVIQPVEPSIGRDYIGRVFAICVLGGMGSFAGTLVAAMTLGIVESLTSTFYGPSWSPAVAFGFLLVTLAVRPAGIFGR